LHFFLHFLLHLRFRTTQPQPSGGATQGPAGLDQVEISGIGILRNPIVAETA
jgi:hypothetical protein